MIKINKYTAKNDKDLIRGVNRYIDIMKVVDKTTFDDDFRKKYNVFYRITPHRKPEWQDRYYEIFSKYRNLRDKKEKFTIRNILVDIKEETGRVEFSFASKMLHSLYPKKYPIYDSIVARVLKLEKMPVGKDKDKKIDKACEIYNDLICKIKDYDYLAKDYDLIFGDKKISDLNETIDFKKISDLKKKDFLIWWYGHGKK